MRDLKRYVTRATYILVLISIAFSAIEAAEIDGCPIEVETATTFYSTKNCTNSSERIHDELFGSQKRKLIFLAGKQNNTYHQMALNFANLMKCNCIYIGVEESGGSNDILDKILSARNAKLGLVQSDVLNSRYSDPSVKANLRVVAVLHTEEVHFIVKQSEVCDPETTDCSYLNSLTDYINKAPGEKRIYLGAKGSGTLHTAQNILNGKNIDMNSFINAEVKGDEPFKAIENDEIDAFFTVIGAPAFDVSKLLKSKNGKQFKLLPIAANVSGYARAKINPSSAYLGLDANGIETVSVNAVLVTYNWQEEGKYDANDSTGENEFKQLCDLTRTMHSKLENSLSELVERAKSDRGGVNFNWSKVSDSRISSDSWVESECIKRN